MSGRQFIDGHLSIHPLLHALLLYTLSTFGNDFGHLHLIKEQSTWTKMKNITRIPIVQ